MTAIPPQMWESPEAYEPPTGEEFRDAEAAEPDDPSKHRHAPDCGHEAIPHGDHVDYVHEGHRHFWDGARWSRH